MEHLCDIYMYAHSKLPRDLLDLGITEDDACNYIESLNVLFKRVYEYVSSKAPETIEKAHVEKMEAYAEDMAKFDAGMRKTRPKLPVQRTALLVLDTRNLVVQITDKLRKEMNTLTSKKRGRKSKRPRTSEESESESEKDILIHEQAKEIDALKNVLAKLQADMEELQRRDKEREVEVQALRAQNKSLKYQAKNRMRHVIMSPELPEQPEPEQPVPVSEPEQPVPDAEVVGSDAWLAKTDKIFENYAPSPTINTGVPDFGQ
jgi:hypothetical protein